MMNDGAGLSWRAGDSGTERRTRGDPRLFQTLRVYVVLNNSVHVFNIVVAVDIFFYLSCREV
jgi:hypothetical protein